MNKKTILMILDGWGITQDPKVSAIAQAQTPFIDSLYLKYPNAQLRTDGEHVGLPDGQMGNSEVGHMNLGAGRIVYQDLAKINKAIKDDSLKDNEVLINAIAYAKVNSKKIHFLGLLSDGGVHAHINHLKALLDITKANELEDVFIHAFTDGRDVDPKSGIQHIQEIEKHIKGSNAQLATVTGRYFAMDRDNRWERVKKAYDVMVNGLGTPTHDAIQSIKQSYEDGITDEFIEPMVILNGTEPVATIQDDDVVIFFNYRTDRGRELTDMLSQRNFEEVNTKKLNLHYVTMTKYDDTFKNVQVMFEKENLKNTLGEVLSKAGKKQIRIAETEKYPHVTFFFNGGQENPFEGEQRIMCNSPKVATYDLQPEMSINCVQDKIIPEIESQTADFICLNFANPDMVGHTGSMDAAIAACEAVDSAASHVINKAIDNNYSILVIADHGNCEVMINPDGSVNTAHTTNPVPLILIDQDIKSVKNGILGDVAPTILELMGIEQPDEMTQKSLL
ncbi:2,3-bisphosphoglycerate-independent phosphoglycerate mutase [Nonlabens tegetincola]|uniref:2,3-bisphosphoglycerate-independent phosphoglycerate mutase n=1 Tax=Nonlabens tegetincola TaxID=323273 RepID=A0A090QQV2_9FLAO|nr:2,3-bisphosphoglycerate-independent phosphoglycerate mutase [Nonlabens tegetincola]GAK97861.1 2,3-bisphosphoglycerate-independent phosphoglycerate mutase [Nonlabens tegetincola]